MPNGGYEFDFAISYAGEDEEIAQNLCSLLQRSNASVFFAKEQVGELAGKNLHEVLKMIFQDKSRFCILLISQAYVAKYWTLYEFYNVRERILLSEEGIILPVRLDRVEFA